MYTSLEHYIDGNWVKPTGDKSQDVVNPASSKPIGQLGHVSRGDLDKALAAADKGFKQWRRMSPFERGKILRKAADLVRARTDEIAKVLTQEQGKVLMEAKLEVQTSADIIDWYAAETTDLAESPEVATPVIEVIGRTGNRTSRKSAWYRGAEARRTS